MIRHLTQRDSPCSLPDPGRRRFIRAGLAAAAGLLLPSGVLAAVNRSFPQKKVLAFHHMHTGEDIEVPYWAEGLYIPENLAHIDYILRDHRTGEIRPIDPRLLDLLHVIASKLKSRGPFQVFSGYRSESTNTLLRRRGSRVAKNSLHILGMAIDIRLPDRSVASLRNAAVSLQAGGVGFYPRSRFVHLDVGPVRTW